jgi:hypothetical protein
MHIVKQVVTAEVDVVDRCLAIGAHKYVAMRKTDVYNKIIQSAEFATAISKAGRMVRGQLSVAELNSFEQTTKVVSHNVHRTTTHFGIQMFNTKSYVSVLSCSFCYDNRLLRIFHTRGTT